MTSPTLCVVIPVFNAEAYLAQALASVQLQTFADWELIVLDDGSTDASVEIARAFAATDPRITVQHDGQNRGLVFRLNQMPTLTTAPLLARMDADDLMHPERLARQVEVFARRSELDVLGTAAYAIDQSSEPYGFKAAPPIPEDAAGFLAASPLIHPSVMLRRAWLAQHPYDACYERAEDYELWWRTQSHTVFMNLPEPLLFYRERGLPYRGKYRRSSQARRRLLRQIGRQAPWRGQAIQVTASTLVKDLLYDLATVTRREHLLIERRSRPLTAAELLDARLALGPALEAARRLTAAEGPR